MEQEKQPWNLHKVLKNLDVLYTLTRHLSN